MVQDIWDPGKVGGPLTSGLVLSQALCGLLIDHDVYEFRGTLVELSFFIFSQSSVLPRGPNEGNAPGGERPEEAPYYSPIFTHIQTLTKVKFLS